MSITYRLRKVFNGTTDKMGEALVRFKEIEGNPVVPFVVFSTMIFGSYQLITKDEIVPIPPARFETVAPISDPNQTAIKDANTQIDKIAQLQKKLTQSKINFELLPETKEPTAAFKEVEKTITLLTDDLNRQTRQFEVFIFTNPQISEQQAAQLANRYSLLTGQKLSFYRNDYSLANTHFNYRDECLLSTGQDHSGSTKKMLKALDYCMDDHHGKTLGFGKQQFDQFIIDSAQAVGLGLAGSLSFSALAGLGAKNHKRRKAIKPN